MKRTGTVQWLNRSDLARPRNQKTVESIEFISGDAWAVLKGQVGGVRLMKDHAVPVGVLYDQLNAQNPHTSRRCGAVPCRNDINWASSQKQRTKG